MLIALFLSTPAMIWDNIMQDYHEWTYNEAVKSVEDSFNEAAAKTTTSAIKNIDNYIPNFEMLRNDFYGDGQGGVSTMLTEDGGEFSVSIDESGKDVLLTYYNAKTNEFSEIRYINGNNFVNSPVNVNYTEIINAFTLYRSKNEDTNEYVYNSDTKTFTSNGEPSGYWKQSPDFSVRAWGMTDTAAIRKILAQNSYMDSLYKIDYLLGDNKEKVSDATTKDAMAKANNKNKAKEKGYDKYYQVAIQVSTFESETVELSNGTSYNKFTQKMFGLSDEEMKYVADLSMISDIIVESAITASPVADDFSEYFIFSPEKNIFENIMGGKSVLQQMSDDGLIMNNLTGPLCRSLVAAQAQKVAASKMAITYDNFFGIKSDDTFTKYFGNEIKNSNPGDPAMFAAQAQKVAASKMAITYDNFFGIKSDDTFTKYFGNEIKNSNPGDPAMFATYVFYSTLKNNELSLREVLFQSDKILSSTKDYADYFISHNQYYPKNKIFDTKGKMLVEKGDVLFFSTEISMMGSIVNGQQMPPTHSIQNNTQLGIVTQVRGSTVDVAVYNFDHNCKKSTSAELETVKDIYNWTYDALVSSGGYKAEVISIDFSNNNNKYVSSVSGYGKPDYNLYASKYNAVYAEKIQKLNESKNCSNPNMGTGEFGYPVESRKGKPDYNLYASKYNAVYAEKIQKLNESKNCSNPNMGTGEFGYPVESRKISAGFPRYPSGRYHSGIDFPIPVGTKVYAAQSGTVVISWISKISKRSLSQWNRLPNSCWNKSLCCSVRHSSCC